jgi:hypothetical protein
MPGWRRAGPTCLLEIGPVLIAVQQQRGVGPLSSVRAIPSLARAERPRGLSGSSRCAIWTAFSLEGDPPSTGTTIGVSKGKTIRRRSTRG